MLVNQKGENKLREDLEKIFDDETKTRQLLDDLTFGIDYKGVVEKGEYIEENAKSLEKKRKKLLDSPLFEKKAQEQYQNFVKINELLDSNYREQTKGVYASVTEISKKLLDKYEEIKLNLSFSEIEQLLIKQVNNLNDYVTTHTNIDLNYIFIEQQYEKFVKNLRVKLRIATIYVHSESGGKSRATTIEQVGVKNGDLIDLIKGQISITDEKWVGNITLKSKKFDGCQSLAKRLLIELRIQRYNLKDKELYKIEEEAIRNIALADNYVIKRYNETKDKQYHQYKQGNKIKTVKGIPFSIDREGKEWGVWNVSNLGTLTEITDRLLLSHHLDAVTNAFKNDSDWVESNSSSIPNNVYTVQTADTILEDQKLKDRNKEKLIHNFILLKDFGYKEVTNVPATVADDTVLFFKLLPEYTKKVLGIEEYSENSLEYVRIASKTNNANLGSLGGFYTIVKVKAGVLEEDEFKKIIRKSLKEAGPISPILTDKLKEHLKKTNNEGSISTIDGKVREVIKDYMEE